MKADVNAIEKEMLSVRDELDAERFKTNKLDKLVRQYSSYSSSVSTAATASKGTLRSGNINSFHDSNSSGGTTGVRASKK